MISPRGPSAGPGTTSATETTAPARPTPVATLSKVAEVEGITEYRMENGLRVLLLPDPSQAKVAVNVVYLVGSRHEGYGESGMAHLLEHMTFKGTPERPDMITSFEARGAIYGANTWFDRTSYYAIMPADDDNVAFALALEADRMQNAIIAAEDLASEFTVVRNEFERGETAPEHVLMERLNSSAYLWHGYGRSTIGNKSDIERVDAEALRRFYKRYYRPDNAVVIITGRFDVDTALAEVRSHFGAMPRPDTPLPDIRTIEPVQDGEREIMVRRTGDVGLVGVVYHTVPASHADHAAVSALADILTAEPSGALYQALVAKGKAGRVWGNAWPSTERGTVLFMAEVPAGKLLEPVRDIMLDILEKHADGKGQATGAAAVDKAALERYQRGAARDFEQGYANSAFLALDLTEPVATGDWRMHFIERDRKAGLTVADVQRVARAYFKRSNRTVGFFVPTAEPDRVAVVEAPDIAALTRDYKGHGPGMDQGEAFDSSFDNIEARTRRTTLESGAKVALLPKDTRGDIVYMVMLLHVGSAADYKGRDAGAQADILGEMVARGTKTRSHQELKDALDKHEASVTVASTGLAGPPENIRVLLATKRDHLVESIAIVAEMLKTPRLTKDNLEEVRVEYVNDLMAARGDPQQLAESRLASALRPFPASDIRHVPSLDEQLARVQEIELASLQRMHAQLWGADAATIAVVGDFDEAAVSEALATHFGSWRAKRPYKRIEVPYRAASADDLVIAMKDKKNAFLALGQSVEIRDDHPDYPALALLVYLTAEVRSSRLWKRLRTDDGLSYRVYGNLDVGSFDTSGTFTVSAICAPENVDKAMAAMLEELERLRRDGVPADELERYKTAWIERSATVRSMDQALVWSLASEMHAGRTLRSWQGIDQRISELTVVDMKRVIDTYLDPERFIRVRAGDLPTP